MRPPRLAPLVAVILCALGPLAGAAPARAQSAGSAVRFRTSLGDVDVQLRPDAAPRTVANFLNYVNRGAYNGSFIHRVTTLADTGIAVAQGGGFTFTNANGVGMIPTDPPVPNEPNLPNARGTLALAKSNDPNSGTDQWYFNDADNFALDDPANNGGYTVFGQIVGDAGLAVLDAIAAVPTYHFDSPFNQIPLVNYQGANVTTDNLVTVFSVSPVTLAVSSTVSVVGNPARGGFVVSRPGGLDAPVTVAYHNGGSAARGVDYETFPGTLTLAAGQGEAVIPVRLLPGANRNRKVKVFLDPAPNGEYQIGKAQSKVFLSDLP